MCKNCTAPKIGCDECSYNEGFDDWRDAIRAACQPLLQDGTIEPEYIDAIIGTLNIAAA